MADKVAGEAEKELKNKKNETAQEISEKEMEDTETPDYNDNNDNSQNGDAHSAGDAKDIEDTENTNDTVPEDLSGGDPSGQCQDEEEEKPEGEKPGGKFFKKKKDKKDEMIEELNDKYTRLFAEFDNFRKRSEKEKSAMFEVGAKAIIEKILPVVDNFERGLATISDEEKNTGFADGMDKVYRQLITSLEEAGVKPIEAVGREFDPNLHNAVMHVEDEELGENVIAEEFQKGYTYRETVVRHSMVKVAN